MANFYADEQFPKKTTIALRALGHDVLTVQEAGNANQKIPEGYILPVVSKLNTTSILFVIIFIPC